MKVYGVYVPPEVDAACMRRMQERVFTALDIAEVAREAEFGGGYNCWRLADRLIQRERKAGHIKWNGKYWTWQS